MSLARGGNLGKSLAVQWYFILSGLIIVSTLPLTVKKVMLTCYYHAHLFHVFANNCGLLLALASELKIAGN